MQILVWKNKYSDRFYDASTDAKLERAARDILTTLIEDDWMYEPDAPEWTEAEAEVLAMSKEGVEALPTTAREAVQKERKRLAARSREFTDAFEHYEAAKAAAAGTPMLTVFRQRTSHRDDEWAEVLEFATTNWPDAVVKNGKVYRPKTAWSILKDRDGAEYESYSLDDVISFED